MIVILLFISCNKNHTQKPEIKKGIVDLSKWNFEKNGTFYLTGDWEFYWNNLLEPEDFRKNKLFDPDYINVPYSWTKKNKSGRSYPEFGYGTYRLRIIVPDDSANYKFHFSSIFSSAKVWINGAFCFEKGKVGTTKEESEPKLFISYFLENQLTYSKTDTLEIVIQVADFYKGGSYGGLIRKISFGPTNLIYKQQRILDLFRFGLIGILLLITVYHLFLFTYNKHELSYLFFSFISFVCCWRVLYTSGVIVDFIPYDWIFIVAFFPIFIYPPLMAAFFYLLFKDEVNRRFVYATLIVGLIFIPFAFASSPNSINRLEPLSILFSLTVILYFIGYSLIKTIIRKREGAIYAYVGTLFLFVSNIHDALYSQGLTAGFGMYITEYGFGLYIIMQAMNLAKNFSITLKNNISLNNELEYQNRNLEAIVINRTKTIDNQRLSLENQNQNLLQQKEEINKQNEELSKKNKEITDSINYGKRIQSALLTPETYISELLHDYFILYKPKDIVSGDFYWIKQVNQYIIVTAVDCTGHGIPGAFMSMLGLSFLNEIIQRREITQANQILNELRSQVKHSLRQHGQRDESKDGMDIALCVIDPKNRLIQFSGANNPLYLIREINGSPELTEIKGDRMPIGFYHGLDKTFTNHELQIEMGDTIYIFTDGFIDQIGGKENKKFLSKNFKNLLLENYLLSMYEQKVALDDSIQKWMSGQPQTDDILVIGIRF
jgi:serine phosphatase RsbU (regulator of sigma subunit)